MRQVLRIVSAVVGVALLATGLVGCGGAGGYAPDIDPAEFAALVDNLFFPLTPGTTFVYEGENGDGEAETITVVVTPQTKQILGVTCTQVRDTVEVEGELAEDTLDWYAQHQSGTVWYFGEDTKEYENGVVVSTAGSWEAGVDGAKAGIIMQGTPQVGQAYRQEFYRGEAEDMARVLRLDASVTVPFGSFDDCLVTREWTPLDPGVAENKYYAAGVGLVYEKVVQGGTGFVRLVEVTTG
jgi:hypothetical protein